MSSKSGFTIEGVLLHFGKTSPTVAIFAYFQMFDVVQKYVINDN